MLNRREMMVAPLVLAQGRYPLVDRSGGARVSGAEASVAVKGSPLVLVPPPDEDYMLAAARSEDRRIADRVRRRYIELLGTFTAGDESIVTDVVITELGRVLGVRGPLRRS